MFLLTQEYREGQGYLQRMKLPFWTTDSDSLLLLHASPWPRVFEYFDIVCESAVFLEHRICPVTWLCTDTFIS